MSDSRNLYGLVAEFGTPEALVVAARETYRNGYRRMEAYAPFPIEELAEVMGFHRTGMPLIFLLGGITGALTAYAMQAYSSIVSYPLNVGGRPLHSLPAFIPIIFELTVLFAALSGFFGMLVL